MNSKLQLVMQQLIDERMEGYALFKPIASKIILHDIILLSLHNSGLLADLVFQGGTCLQRMYGWPRLSEDLDFVFPGTPKAETFFVFGEKFCDIIIKDMQKILDIHRENIEIIPPKNAAYPSGAEPELRRWRMKIDIGQRNQKSVINIEVANIPAYKVEEKVFRPLVPQLQIPNFLIKIESLEEILTDKAVALLRRPYLKFRDIFDISLLKEKNISFNTAMFIKKLADYGTTLEEARVYAAEKQQLLSQASVAASFWTEMDRFLLPSLARQMQRSHWETHALASAQELIGEVVALSER